jgi:RyR domain-containing protein
LETPETIEQAARVCHEALRAYSQTLGDNSLPPWEDAPEWQRESSRDGVRFQFAQFAAGIEAPASATHDEWLKQRRAAGWKRGETKDHQTREHPSFVAYADLPVAEKLKDYLFAAICKAFSQSAADETGKTAPRE